MKKQDKKKSGGLLSKEPLTREQIEELVKNTDPDGYEKYKNFIREDKFGEVDPTTIKIRH